MHEHKLIITNYALLLWAGIAISTKLKTIIAVDNLEHR